MCGVGEVEKMNGKETGIILIYVITGVILWCIGIDNGEFGTRMTGAGCMAVAAVVNLVVLLRKGE